MSLFNKKTNYADVDMADETIKETHDQKLSSNTIKIDLGEIYEEVKTKALEDVDIGEDSSSDIEDS